MIYALWLICLAFAVARPFMPTHAISGPGTYEAFAHLFVGGLIGAWIASRRRVLLWMAGLISAVELTVFLAGRV